MDEDELKNKVNLIISLRGDDEAAHSKEDNLHREIIKKLCPAWVVAEVERLSQADFNRWRA